MTDEELKIYTAITLYEFKYYQEISVEIHHRIRKFAKEFCLKSE